VHFALGRPFAGRDVQQGSCLMLCGENPDDVRIRCIAYAEQMGFATDEIPIYFMAGVFSIKNSLEDIGAISRELGDLAFISVDTSAAYFEGEDENSNPQLLEHAKTLRQLSLLPGRPCVLANCHPIKNPTKDNLLPRGGSSFLNEVDGNLTAWKEDDGIEVHQAGKFRGPDFEPIPFELLKVTSLRLVSKQGKQIPTVIARSITRFEQEAKAAAAASDEQKVLTMLSKSKMLSIAELATGLGWVNIAGEPLKARAQRFTETMKRDGFIKRHGQIWEITDVGKRVLEQKNGH
jgi:AAA domain